MVDFAIGMAAGGWFIRLVCRVDGGTAYCIGITIAAAGFIAAEALLS